MREIDLLTYEQLCIYRGEVRQIVMRLEKKPSQLRTESEKVELRDMRKLLNRLTNASRQRVHQPRLFD